MNMQKGLALVCGLSLLLLFSACSAREGGNPAASVKNSQPTQSAEQDSDRGAENEPEEQPLYEMTVKIHSDVPEMIVRGFGDAGDGGGFTSLTIVDLESGGTVNQINLLEDTLEGGPIPGDFFDIAYIDVNFDGYKDLMIADCMNGNWNVHYIYFVWDQGENRFVPDTAGLSGLGLPEFDEEKQLILSMQRDSAADHWDYTHQYSADGSLALIKEVTDVYVRFRQDVSQEEEIARIIPESPGYQRWSLQYYTVEEMDKATMQMETTEAKFQFYTSEDWVLLGEYDVDSKIGRQLYKLVDWESMP